MYIIIIAGFSVFKLSVVIGNPALIIMLMQASMLQKKALE
jgi:hypothetical protein